MISFILLLNSEQHFVESTLCQQRYNLKKKFHSENGFAWFHFNGEEEDKKIRAPFLLGMEVLERVRALLHHKALSTSGRG